jgi:hypothetical protein
MGRYNCHCDERELRRERESDLYHSSVWGRDECERSCAQGELDRRQEERRAEYAAEERDQRRRAEERRELEREQDHQDMYYMQQSYEEQYDRAYEEQYDRAVEADYYKKEHANMDYESGIYGQGE